MTQEEIAEDDAYNHGVIAEIAEVEEFAEHQRGARRGEADGGLAAEEGLLQGGEVVVHVGEEAIELVGVGVPVGQEAQLEGDTDEGGEFAGIEAIGLAKQEGAEEDEEALDEHLSGVVHIGKEEGNEEAGEEVVGEAYLLHCQESLLRRFALKEFEVFDECEVHIVRL
jgi:hypothetical protein